MAERAHEGAVRGAGLRRLLYDLRHRRERFRQFLGVVIAIVLAFTGHPARPAYHVGLALFVLGSVVRLWASGHVRKDRELATDGPYGFVRHPLYVGNILILAGFCTASGLWWSWLLGLVFLLAFYPPAIRQEDAKLQHLFGDAWRSWRAEVRALLPRARSWRGAGAGSWSPRQSLVQNGEPIIATFLLILMLVLWLKLP
jgi:protein-S-isoprenylcysteine O-methyltransferase Ste14